MEKGVTSNDVERLTNEIWNSMLDIDLRPSSKVPIPRPRISACVQILGQWEGAVQLELSVDLARQAAAAFTGADHHDVTREQILDAAGELANMTAGGLKGLLPKPSCLSLPSVVEGIDFHHTLRKGRVVLDSSFTAGDGSLLITVIESNVAPEARS